MNADFKITVSKDYVEINGNRYLARPKKIKTMFGEVYLSCFHCAVYRIFKTHPNFDAICKFTECFGEKREDGISVYFK